MRRWLAPLRGFGSLGIIATSLLLVFGSCQNSERRIGGRPLPNPNPIEANISHGLEWLRKNQNAYGSWGNDDVGITSLAMLAHLEAGVQLDSDCWEDKKRFRDQFSQAVVWLRSRQDKNTRQIGWNDDLASLIRHSIATVALTKASENIPSFTTRRMAGLAVKHLKDEASSNNDAWVLWALASADLDSIPKPNSDPFNQFPS